MAEMHSVPSDIRLRRKSGILELGYASGMKHELPAEFLRVYSPSAAVRGHGAGQEVLQTGKKHVQLTGVEAIGNYAIKLIFDDGHDSGIYTWEYLYNLGAHYESYWQDYLERLHQAGASRDPDLGVVKFME
ncbi:DUF971 domain-containing protein [Kistimonas scapharcae]|uniref:DUF971 domain-containing protein n=2 Tax=Kistimonas scapharcae TaxID=1036133 RepID=A0ABP8UXX0_9GAMM